MWQKYIYLISELFGDPWEGPDPQVENHWIRIRLCGKSMSMIDLWEYCCCFFVFLMKHREVRDLIWCITLKQTIMCASFVYKLFLYRFFQNIYYIYTIYYIYYIQYIDCDKDCYIPQ